MVFVSVNDYYEFVYYMWVYGFECGFYCIWCMGIIDKYWCVIVVGCSELYVVMYGC